MMTPLGQLLSEIEQELQVHTQYLLGLLPDAYDVIKHQLLTEPAKTAIYQPVYGEYPALGMKHMETGLRKILEADYGQKGCTVRLTSDRDGISRIEVTLNRK